MAKPKKNRTAVIGFSVSPEVRRMLEIVAAKMTLAGNRTTMTDVIETAIRELAGKYGVK